MGNRKMDFAAALNGLLDNVNKITREAGESRGISAGKKPGGGGRGTSSNHQPEGSSSGYGGSLYGEQSAVDRDDDKAGSPNNQPEGSSSGYGGSVSYEQSPATMESEPKDQEEKPFDPWGAIIGFLTGGQAPADEGADAVGYYDSDGTVAADGDNDYIATVDSQIQDAIENGNMLNGVDLDEYGIDPDDVDWTSIAWMPAGENVYGKIYGTETVYDADGNAYTVLSDAANEARANDLFYLYSLEGNQEIFGDNWTTDRAAFQKHYDDAISTAELLDNFDEYGYRYAYGDDQAIRELASMIAASGAPYNLGDNGTYDMQQMYQDDPEAYVDNIEAILAQGAMESAGLNDIVDYMNGEYEGDLTVDELQQQAADRLGWREDDLNALTDNENIEYGTGSGWGRNTTAHRGDPVADQYNSGLDDEWLKRSAENPNWNSREYEAPLPVQNMSDNVFAIFDGMSY